MAILASRSENVFNKTRVRKDDEIVDYQDKRRNKVQQRGCLPGEMIGAISIDMCCIKGDLMRVICHLERRLLHFAAREN